VFNYKTADVEKEVRKFGGLDVYWDNVGGEMLDRAVGNMSNGGRVVICGYVSE